MKIKILFFIAILSLIIGCENEHVSPDPGVYEFKGKLIADQFLFQDTLISNAKITLNSNLKSYQTITDSSGYFHFENLPKSEYLVKIENILPYNNLAHLDTILSIPNNNSFNKLVLRKLSKDYFPLHVGNKWEWVGESSGNIYSYYSGWNYKFNLNIEIIEMTISKDTNYYSFSGYMDYNDGYYFKNKDTMNLKSIIKEINGVLKEQGGSIQTTFSSEGSIPEAKYMFSFNKDMLRGGFHSFENETKASTIFSGCSITQESIGLRVTQSNKYHIFAPNIGLSEYYNWNNGNSPYFISYKLTDYKIIE